MKNNLFVFANRLMGSADQMIDDLISSNSAVLMAVFFAGLAVFMIFVFMSIPASTSKSFMNNRGQGAMEYLMTYGWAILVVMIVGVVLWQLGVFNVGQGNLVVTGFVKMQPLTPSLAYRNKAFTGSFTNALGTTIKLSSVTITETISNTVCPAGSLSVSPNNLSANSSLFPSVKAGGTFTLTNPSCPIKTDG
ncbi:MAG: hypothetical protein NT077_00410, partial [Candidatus Taylorbacteria bacterium]|nr:hypothetical protein [Candidatus Taylorbacteria bacterium]